MTAYGDRLRAGEFAPKGGAVSGKGDTGRTSSGPDLEALTVDQLKDMAQAVGLPVSGTKAELIARIQKGA